MAVRVNDYYETRSVKDSREWYVSAVSVEVITCRRLMCRIGGVLGGESKSV